jgi:hypothetical protein
MTVEPLDLPHHAIEAPRQRRLKPIGRIDREI